MPSSATALITSKLFSLCDGNAQAKASMSLKTVTFVVPLLVSVLNRCATSEGLTKYAGTGKTHTVRGILNVWHIVHYNRFLGSLVTALSK